MGKMKKRIKKTIVILRKIIVRRLIETPNKKGRLLPPLK